MKHEDRFLRAEGFTCVKEICGVEPDHPFAKGPDMSVLRHKDTRRWFSILPAYHMDREQWISVLLDGTVPPRRSFFRSLT